MKGLRLVDGAPLLLHHVHAFSMFNIYPRVVLGCEAAAHAAILPSDVEVVYNLRWAETDMAESVAIGLDGMGVVLLTPVDAPPAQPDTLRALLAATGDCVPTWDHQPGHPVRLEPPHPFGRLDVRLAHARRVPVSDPCCIRNLNTPADWDAWLAAR